MAKEALPPKQQAYLKAAMNGDLKGVKAYIKAGGDINVVARNGMSALMLAIWEKGHREVVSYLLDQGIETTLRQPSNQWTALTYATVNGHGEITDELFKRGAKLDEQAGDWKALLYAMTYRNLHTARMLLQHGASVDVRDEKTKQTPLIRAARNSSDEGVEMLLSFKADPNVKDAEGMTALMHAATKANTRSVELLLKAGAKAKLKDKTGRTALVIAIEKKKKAIVEMLG